MNEFEKMIAEMFPQSEQAAIQKMKDIHGRGVYEWAGKPKGYDAKEVLDKANFSKEELLKASAFAREFEEKAFSPLWGDLSDRARMRLIRSPSFLIGVYRALGSREPSPSLETSPRSKSIDDIFKESNVAEFLSKATSDKTNVDVKEDTQVIPSNIGKMNIDVLQQLLNMVEPTKKQDMGTYGGGTVGEVDSPMTLQMLMRTQEPLPQDTSGVGRMDINTLMEILRMQEPVAPR